MESVYIRVICVTNLTINLVILRYIYEYTEESVHIPVICAINHSLDEVI